MHFTIQVYDCGGCPYADHDGERCLDVLNQDWQHTRLDATLWARQVYEENILGLCMSCPRV